tara:strand:+ start:2542 stop:3504 length:963 start_codon:yes stop_codon:yes gene_type:complete
MDKLIKDIDEARNISDGTLKVYETNLRNIHKAVEGDDNFNPDFLEKKDEVLKFIRDKYSKPTQRTYLSAVIVALDTRKQHKLLEIYKEEMAQLRKELDAKIKSGVKTDKQEKNWTTLANLKRVMKGMKQDLIDNDVYRGRKMTKKVLRDLQDYTLLSLYLGDEANPPVRNADFMMKVITNSDYKKLEGDKEFNYLVVDDKDETKPRFFSFNNYKTSARYGTKEIKVGLKLQKILKFWLEHNEGREWLLYNFADEPMTAQQISNRVKTLFKVTGKNITTNLIRSIYVTEKFPREASDEKADVAHKMGHSVETQSKVYSKKK